jgi:cytochrome d ubiquinol oxidase subunit I
MVLAAYLTTALVVGGVGGFHLLRDRANASARVMFSMAMWMAALVAPIQIVAGDQHGLNTLEHQPAKIAAMEGDFDTKAGQPLILIGLPDMKAEKTKFAIEIPDLGSLVLTRDIHGVVRGLKDWPPDQRPDATIIFFSFRIMVGLGFAIFGLGLWSLWARRKGTLFEWPWLHRAAIVLSPAGFIAVLAGWTTTEVGRQPYTVYGLLTTAQSVSPIAPAGVGASLTGFVIVYFCIFGSALFYCLRLMAKPPELAEPDLQPGVPIRAAGVTPIAAIKPDILSPTH